MDLTISRKTAAAAWLVGLAALTVAGCSSGGGLTARSLVPATANTSSPYYTAGKNFAHKYGGSGDPGNINNTSSDGTIANSASAFCADVLYLPQSGYNTLTQDLPASGSELQQWSLGCEAGWAGAFGNSASDYQAGAS